MKPHYFSSSFAHDTNSNPPMPTRISVVVIVFALLALAVTGQLMLDVAGDQGSAAPQTTENPNTSAEFVYFPGQYENQASEATQHIQAF